MNRRINHFLSGGILSGISIFYSIVIILMGEMTNQKLGSVALVLFAGGLIYFVREYGKQNDYSKSFGELFSFGFKSAAFSTILILVFQVLYNFIFPETKEIIFQVTREKMAEDERVTEEMIENAITFMQKGYWPFMIGGIILSNLVTGAIASLIAAAVVKKKPHNPFGDSQ